VNSPRAFLVPETEKAEILARSNRLIVSLDLLGFVGSVDLISAVS
jgi:hypothetical protein